MAAASEPDDIFELYGLPAMPDDSSVGGVTPDIAREVWVEVAQNAMEIEGPVVERVNSRSFGWAQAAFDHAAAYLDDLGRGNPAAGGDRGGVDGAPAPDEADAAPAPLEPVDPAQVGRGVIEVAAAAATDSAGSDDEEPTRFPSRSDKADTTAVDPDDWVVQAVLKRRRQRGQTFWLVQWRYVAEPTWEAEEDLVDEGHGNRLKEFTSKAQADKAQPAAQKRRAKGRGEAVSKKFKHGFNPELFWPNFLAQVSKKFESSGYSVDKITRCLPQAASIEFVKTWARIKETGALVAPAMVFHGTSDYNWKSILQRGFYVPGTGGVRIVNGAAHGVGIYTAVNPGLSMSYVRGQRAMFVCAALVTEDITTSVRNLGNVVVFFKRTLVLPVALVWYRYGPSAMPPRVEDVAPEQLTPGTTCAKAGYSTAAAFWSDPDEAQRAKILSQSGGVVTKKALKKLPAAAKAMYRQGEFGKPKSDRSKK